MCVCVQGRGLKSKKKGGGERTSGIADNANGEPSREAAEPDAQPRAELQEARVQGHPLDEAARDDDADDEAVDGEDLGHDGAEAGVNNPPAGFVLAGWAERSLGPRGEEGEGTPGRGPGVGNGVGAGRVELYARVLHQPIGPDDARGEDGAAGLGRAIGGADDGEDDGDGAPERSEEGLFNPRASGRLGDSRFGGGGGLLCSRERPTA